MSRRRAVPSRGVGYMARRYAPLWCWPGRRRTGFVASGCTPYLLIEAMERHGHGGLDGQNRQQLLAMSAATIDRILTGVRASATGQRRRKGSTAIRRSVPVRTFSDWNNPAPGFVEADLVAHSGPFAKGAFTQTLVLTDIATGWTECAPLLVREQTVLTVALTELRKLLPFALLGFDTDNDSVFMNE